LKLAWFVSTPYLELLPGTRALPERTEDVADVGKVCPADVFGGKRKVLRSTRRSVWDVSHQLEKLAETVELELTQSNERESRCWIWVSRSWERFSSDRSSPIGGSPAR
jgi:hypothetical protein